jgi:phenylacetate-CoA ligase
VRQFQVIQPTLNRLDIYLAPGDGFGDENLKSIQNKLRHNAPGLAVTIHLVEQVSPLPSGKHRFIISHVSAAGRR